MRSRSPRDALAGVHGRPATLRIHRGEEGLRGGDIAPKVQGFGAEQGRFAGRLQALEQSERLGDTLAVGHRASHPGRGHRRGALQPVDSSEAEEALEVRDGVVELAKIEALPASEEHEEALPLPSSRIGGDTGPLLDQADAPGEVPHQVARDGGERGGSDPGKGVGHGRAQHEVEVLRGLVESPFREERRAELGFRRALRALVGGLVELDHRGLGGLGRRGSVSFHEVESSLLERPLSFEQGLPLRDLEVGDGVHRLLGTLPRAEQEVRPQRSHRRQSLECSGILPAGGMLDPELFGIQKVQITSFVFFPDSSVTEQRSLQAPIVPALFKHSFLQMKFISCCA